MDDHGLKDFYKNSLYSNILVIVKTEKNLTAGVKEIIINEKLTMEMIAIDIKKQGTGMNDKG
jgi:hypothetical protein